MVAQCESRHPLDCPPGPVFDSSGQARDLLLSWRPDATSPAAGRQPSALELAAIRVESWSIDPLVLQALRAVIWKVNFGEVIGEWSREIQYLRTTLGEYLARQAHTTLAGSLHEIGVMTQEERLSVSEVRITHSSERVAVINLCIEAPSVIFTDTSNHGSEEVLQIISDLLSAHVCKIQNDQSTHPDNLITRSIGDPEHGGLNARAERSALTFSVHGNHTIVEGSRLRTNQTPVIHRFHLTITVAH